MIQKVDQSVGRLHECLLGIFSAWREISRHDRNALILIFWSPNLEMICNEPRQRFPAKWSLKTNVGTEGREKDVRKQP